MRHENARYYKYSNFSCSLWSKSAVYTSSHRKQRYFQGGYRCCAHTLTLLHRPRATNQCYLSDFHVGLAEPAAMLTTFTSKSINLNSDHTDKNCEHKHTTRHSLCLPLVRNVEHIAADVYAKPDVSGLFQRFAAQATPTPDVENEARFSWLRPMMFPRIRCKGE